MALGIQRCQLTSLGWGQLAKMKVFSNPNDSVILVLLLLQGREQPRNPRGMKLLPLGQELQYLAAGEARSAIWGW